MTASFAARIGSRTSNQYVEVRVFAGPDADHRALAGSLLLRPSEAVAFIAMVDTHSAPGSPS